MENKFIPQAIEIVTLAINEDNSKNYEEAFRLYKKALEHFMVGVKCALRLGVASGQGQKEERERACRGANCTDCGM